VPSALQPGAQLTVVVDLAIEHDRDGAILVEDGLVAGGQVDDPESLDPKADARRDVQTTGVRPAVLQRLTHPFEHASLGRPTVTSGLSDDSAHDEFRPAAGV
jgi:hypothetical protein